MNCLTDFLNVMITLEEAIMIGEQMPRAFIRASVANSSFFLRSNSFQPCDAALKIVYYQKLGKSVPNEQGED